MSEESNWENESPATVPSETGHSLDEWKEISAEDTPAVTEPPADDEKIDWDTFKSKSVRERQRLLGLPQTGAWGSRERAAYEKARGSK